MLAQHGIHIQPISYPTVTLVTERLRITPTPLHALEQVNHLVEALTVVFRAHGIDARQTRH
jgi:5-aminolevulinate synthase